MGEKLIPAGCTDMISSLKRAVCIDHENLRIFAAILLKSATRVKLRNAIMDDYNGMSRFSHYYCLIVHVIVQIMDETFKQEFKCKQSVTKNERGIVHA